MLFDALIVDPDPFRRSNLWQATLVETSFHSVKAVSQLENALEQLLGGCRYDVLLITSGFELPRVKQFISEAKKTEAGKEAAYVLVLKRKDQEAEGIAESLLDGTDGFLLEPFSVNSLKQVAVIAARVKGEHEKERAQVAITLMLNEVTEQLDSYAEMQRKSKEPGPFAKQLKKLSGGLKKVMKAHKDLYHKLAPEIFEKGKPRQSKSKYKGASTRVKKMEEEND